MVLKKGKYGIATGASLRSGQNRRKIQNEAKSTHLVRRTVVLPSTTYDHQKFPIDQYEEECLFTQKMSKLINDGLPCNPKDIYHDIEFSTNKRKGWLLEKTIASAISDIRMESQLYSTDNDRSNCLPDLPTDVFPRIRLQVIASDFVPSSWKTSRCHCEAYYDSSLENYHPIGKHKYSYATDLLHKEKPAVLSKRAAQLKQARQKQRMNQYKNRHSRGVQRKACVPQKLRTGFFSPALDNYQVKNEAMELKDNEVMYLMWKDRQVTGYHKLWEVYKARDREREKGQCRERTTELGLNEQLQDSLHIIKQDVPFECEGTTCFNLVEIDSEMDYFSGDWDVADGDNSCPRSNSKITVPLFDLVKPAKTKKVKKVPKPISAETGDNIAKKRRLVFCEKEGSSVLTTTNNIEAAAGVDEASWTVPSNQELQRSGYSSTASVPSESVPPRHAVDLNLETASIECSALMSQLGSAYTEGCCVPRTFAVDLSQRIALKLQLVEESSHVTSAVIFREKLPSTSSSLTTYSVWAESSVGFDNLRNDLLTMACNWPKTTPYDIVAILTQTLSRSIAVTAEEIAVSQTGVQKNKAFDFLHSTLRWPLTESCARPSLATFSNAQVSSQATAVTEAFVKCCICWDTFDKEQVNECSALAKCRHWVCNVCWQNYLASELDSGHLPLTCPETNCTSEMTGPLLLSLMAHVRYSRSCDLVESHRLQHDTRWQQCPNRLCGKAYYADFENARSSAMPVACSCGATWCFGCRQPPHWPATCQHSDDYFKLLCDRGDGDYFSDKSKVSFVSVKRCSSCKELIEKGPGCNHMNCRCGFQFCWACLRPWGNHGDRGCPQTANLQVIRLIDHVDSGLREYHYGGAIANRKALFKLKSKQSNDKLVRGECSYLMAVQASQGQFVHKVSVYYDIISNPMSKDTYIAKDVYAVLLQFRMLLQYSHATLLYQRRVKQTFLKKSLHRLKFICEQLEHLLLEPLQAHDKRTIHKRISYLMQCGSNDARCISKRMVAIV